MPLLIVKNRLPPPADRAKSEAAAFCGRETLKRDFFGRSRRGFWEPAGGAEALEAVQRDTTCGPRILRPLAKYLAAREARALRALEDLREVPDLLVWDKGLLIRTWLAGEPLQNARPSEPDYFGRALVLLIRLHRRRVTHNDLAKEPNWLMDGDGLPALVDFQLAKVHRKRGRIFRLQAREDIRHLLKHKRTYCPQYLTPREQAILRNPSWVARIWRLTGKRVYLWITRGLFGWADREGAGDRNW